MENYPIERYNSRKADYDADPSSRENEAFGIHG